MGVIQSGYSSEGGNMQTSRLEYEIDHCIAVIFIHECPTQSLLRVTRNGKFGFVTVGQSGSILRAACRKVKGVWEMLQKSV